MLMNEALAAYLTQLEADGRSPHTVRQAARHVRALERWLADPEVTSVTHEVVARFLGSEAVRERQGGGPRKASSGNAIRSSIRCFFAFVHAAGYAPANAARLVRRARTRPTAPRGVAEGDAERLLAALAEARTPSGRRDHALFALMLRAGLRLGSAVGLDVEDVDFEAGELRLRRVKGGGEEAAILPDSVAGLLREHIGERTSGPLFLSTQGTRVGARQVRRRLAGWGKRLGLRDLHPHALRHAFAMRVYERSGDLLVTAAALGHRSVSSTQVYARVGRASVVAALS
jgi:site-specific recombinase XerC